MHLTHKNQAQRFFQGLDTQCHEPLNGLHLAKYVQLKAAHDRGGVQHDPQLGVSKINGSFTEEHNDYIVGLSQGKLDGEGSCGLKAYTLVELTWMVFEAGSELKLVTDGVVTVTTFVVFVDTDAGVGEVTFVPLV